MSQLASQQPTQRDLRLYAFALNSIHEAVIVTAADGRIAYVNAACEQVYGYREAELIGQPLVMLVPAAEALGVDDSLLSSSQRDTWRGQVEGVRRGGEKFWVEMTLTAVRDEAQEVIGRIAVHRDIGRREDGMQATRQLECQSSMLDEIGRLRAELKLLEDQLIVAQKMEPVGRLAGGMAHDFNNLLTPIVSYAELSAAALPHDSQLRGYQQEILKAAECASHLTQQLLAFSRHQTVEPRVLSLNEVILNIDKMLRRLIGKDIELVTVPAPDLGLARADPGQIEQVLVNLAVNARDAMPHGGRLVIESANVTVDQGDATRHSDKAPGEYVTVAVSDTGTGMPSEVQARIFEPFFTTKEPGKGTGLGLSTSHGIVARSGGHITVESELGKGTTVKIYLPKVHEAAGPLPYSEESDSLPTGRETVLVVDDEPVVREVVSGVLSELGYSVLEASNGHEALGVAETHPDQQVHLLLTDLIMPLMGGEKLAGRIREIHPETRVLYISGYTDDAIVDEPGTEFMQKPFTPTVLARRVREVLEV